MHREHNILYGKLRDKIKCIVKKATTKIVAIIFALDSLILFKLYTNLDSKIHF